MTRNSNQEKIIVMPEIPNDDEKTRLTPALVTLGLRTLSQRTFAYLALGLTAGAFAFVLYDPNYLRLAALAMWGAFILLSGAIKGGAK